MTLDASDIKQIRQVVKEELKAYPKREEMHQGFEAITDMIQDHMNETDKRFKSDRARIAKLERIVL